MRIAILWLFSCVLLGCGPEGSWLVRSMDAVLTHEVPLQAVAAAWSDTAALRLDTRSRAEYAVSHLPGAIWVGYEAFDSAAVAAWPRDRRLLVYCSVGIRSERIGARLQAMGFDSVANLAGGLFEWHNQGLPLHNAQGLPTDTVHGYDRKWGVWVQRGAVVYVPAPE